METGQIFYQILIYFNLRKCFHRTFAKSQFSKFVNTSGYGNKICTIKEDLPNCNLVRILPTLQISILRKLVTT